MYYDIKYLQVCDSLGSSAGKESTWNAGDSVRFLGQEDPLEKG